MAGRDAGVVAGSEHDGPTMFARIGVMLTGWAERGAHATQE